jgi:hypothetical protein
MADKQFTRIDKALSMYGALLKAKYKEQLLADKTYASGKTSDSISYTRGRQTLTMKFDKSLEAIDEGTKDYRQDPSGTPSISNIMAWMNAKGIKGRNQKTGKFIRQDRAAFAIARYIQKNGTIQRFNKGGTSILSKVYNEIADKLGEDILQAWELDVMDNLNQSLPNATTT